MPQGENWKFLQLKKICIRDQNGQFQPNAPPAQQIGMNGSNRDLNRLSPAGAGQPYAVQRMINEHRDYDGNISNPLKTNRSSVPQRFSSF